jgi:uncharacterized protein
MSNVESVQEMYEAFGRGDIPAVLVEFMFDAIAPTGEHLHDEEMHLYDFDENGLVKRVRHYVDTAKHMKAAQVGAAAA